MEQIKVSTFEVTLTSYIINFKIKEGDVIYNRFDDDLLTLTIKYILDSKTILVTDGDDQFKLVTVAEFEDYIIKVKCVREVDLPKPYYTQQEIPFK